MRDKINYLKKFSLEMFTAVLACVKCLLGKLKKKKTVLMLFCIFILRFGPVDLITLS